MSAATNELRFISSMATKALLNELAAQFAHVAPVRVESVGGVDAAKRVQASENFDGIALASNAIDALIASGHALSGSRVDLVHSGVAVAVREGAPRPDIGSEAAVKQTVLTAKTIGYSTGPSGVQLMTLFERWGIADELKPRIVQAPPGVPVGSLVAQGQVELGFQQLSELMSLPGLTVLGALPEAIQIVTTFSAAIASTSTQPEAVRALLAAWASADAAATKRRHGMTPAG